jgi:hypothetical protein
VVSNQLSVVDSLLRKIRPLREVSVRLAVLLVSGLLVGCVNQLAAREARLRQLIGQPETVLVQQMGVPTRAYETQGTKYLAYVEQRIDIIPTFPSYSPFFPSWYGGGFPPQVVDLRCETTFEVVGGSVRGFSLRGNACG